MQHLTQAIERGIGVDAILDRMGEIEKESLALQEKLRTLGIENGNRIDIVDTAQAISDFNSNFDKIFDQATMEEKKLLIKLCISEIVVKRERGVIQLFVRKIPAVSPQLEKLYKNKKALTRVVSAQSGGRT